MKRLVGIAKRGIGVATPNLRHCEDLIATRIGLPRIVSGTLDVAIPEPYQVRPDAALSALEYNGLEVILLQRCVVAGHAVVIMRPHTHELRPAGQPYNREGLHQLELMAPFRFADVGISVGTEVSVEVEGDSEWWGQAVQRQRPAS